ncbi:unnamed protein product [Toxocara canis]|uniref:RRM domain-containing protein n=1 Tax=Toxocara canis TaxID=6265 RepID=A0A183UMM4_TOXCA|nr:unnamed protein product [Toxocara canis]
MRQPTLLWPEDPGPKCCKLRRQLKRGTLGAPMAFRPEVVPASYDPNTPFVHRLKCFGRMAPRDMVVKCRGLPWSCTEEEIRLFFEPAERSIVKVTLTKNRDARPSGEAFVTFDSEEDYEYALTKDKQHMGKRYIEVFPASASDVEYNITGPERRLRTGISLPGRGTSVVRLRGLPYGCTNDEIVRFFHPLPIADNGIVMPYDHRSGKATGEAFVAFYEPDAAERALERNRNNIQHRYIEVFSSSYGEMLHALEVEEGRGEGGGSWRNSRFSPYERYQSYGPRGYGAGRSRRHGGSSLGWLQTFAIGYGGGLDRAKEKGSLAHSWDGGDAYSEPYGGRLGGGPIRRGWRDDRVPPPRSRRYAARGRFFVRMRGLPYRATECDIADFFYPLRPSTIDILTEYGTGRPSGEAVVEFLSLSERDDALRRDRKHMGKLFYCS